MFALPMMLVLALAAAVPAAAEQRSGAPADAVARALEQTDCPLTLEPLDLVHDDRGSTVKVRVLNEGRAEVTRFALGAWVLMPDGTVRGFQKFDQKQAIAAGADRQASLTLRTVRVAPTDAVVLAVLETAGDAWKGDVKALEAEARALPKR